MKKLLFNFLFLSLAIFVKAQCDVDFGATSGQYTFPYVSTSDIVNGASSGANGVRSHSFNIWDEGAAPLDCNVVGGVEDITFDFEILHAFDANTPGDGIIDTYAGSTHDIIQSPSGLNGNSPLGNSGANETSTGDVRGYKITVKFANHINITADVFSVLTNSVNTAGKAFESTAIVFLKPDWTSYGTATYEGYYGAGSAGASTNGACSTPSPGVAWSTTGTGVYVMASTSTVMLDIPANPCNTIAGSDGPDDLNKEIEAVTDGGLLAADPIGGFIFTVYLEDIAPSSAPGANTTTSTTFGSTVKGFSVNNPPLPVELISFDAKVLNDNILLNWITASEVDNDYFEIEHSVNGIDFVKIGNIEGKGQSNFANDYRFIDTQPKDGINYYRLKQIDFDGKYEYGDIVFVEYKTSGKVKIYPSLSSSEINVTLPESGKDITYKIITFTGQIWQEGSFDNVGANTNIDIQKLPAGNYLIQIGNKSFSETLRFNKI